MQCDVLILPGLYNSGPDHWQTLWHQQHPHWKRATHRDWSSPARDEWVAELDAAIAECDGAPILMAHSLACINIAHWVATKSPLKVAGAFLVAPADSESSAFPTEQDDWAPVPLARLPFPSMVVSSNNDPYSSLARATEFARVWGSELVDIGPAEHINSYSGHGQWPQGLHLFQQFCAALNARP